MEQTIKNMGSIIMCVDNELKNQNFKEAKTLMNTYRTLLQRFSSLTCTDSTIDTYKDTLIKHRNKLMDLHEYIERIIPSGLKNKQFKTVDILADTATRLEYSAKSIQSIFTRRDKHIREIENIMKLNNK